MSWRQLFYSLFLVLAAAAPQSAWCKCMVKTVVGVSGETGTIIAVAPDKNSGDLDAAGFENAPCGSLDKAAYREAVCREERVPDYGGRRRLELQAGVSFAQRCNAARNEAGLAPQVARAAEAVGGGANFNPLVDLPIRTAEARGCVLSGCPPQSNDVSGGD